MMPRNACLLHDHVASVSRCRAAGGRCGARAFFALQIPAIQGTRHQTKARPDANGLTRKDLSPVFQRLGTSWGRSKPLFMRCPQCPQSKCRYPEAQTWPMPRKNRPAAGCLGWCGWPGLAAGGGVPPVLGSWTVLAVKSNSNRVISLEGGFGKSPVFSPKVGV